VYSIPLVRMVTKKLDLSTLHLLCSILLIVYYRKGLVLLLIGF